LTKAMQYQSIYARQGCCGKNDSHFSQKQDNLGLIIQNLFMSKLLVLPVSSIPIAMSAIRSLIHLRRRIIDIRDTRHTRDPLKLLLPELPRNPIRDQANDPARMQATFSQNQVYRAALDARGLLENFDLFHNNIDPQTGDPLEFERHGELFWRFMGLYYRILDEEANVAIAPDFEIDDRGLDRFIIRSAKSGNGQQGLSILRASAEVLVDFLGDNASIFLAKSSNRLVLSTVLQEFATASDIETDTPKRILKTLIGAVAVGAAEHGSSLSDKPAAVLLIAALGRSRTEFGDDFLARIITHEGFSAVMSDWVKNLAKDPYLTELIAEMKGLDNTDYDPSDPASLPAKLQPVFGALQKVLGVVGDNIGTRGALVREGTFRAVLAAVLNGLTSHSGNLLRKELDGDRFMATLLQSVIAKIGRTGSFQNDDLIAPIFNNLLGSLAEIIPELGQDEALSRAELMLQDLSERLETGEIQAVLEHLKSQGKEQFARDLMIELFGRAQVKLNARLEGDPSWGNNMALVLLAQVPELLDHSLDRNAVLQICDKILGQIVPADTPESSLARDILPAVTGLLRQLGNGRPSRDPKDVEFFIASWIQTMDQDRPVWRTLHSAGLLQPLIAGIGAALSGNAVPRDFSLDLLLTMSLAASRTLSRHGLKLTELAQIADNPDAFLRDRVSELVEQAAKAAFEQLGRAAGGADMAPVLSLLLDTALSCESMAVLTLEQLEFALERALTEHT
jgi:hypothetical protein